jgi:hypothetical protein
MPTNLKVATKKKEAAAARSAAKRPAPAKAPHRGTALRTAPKSAARPKRESLPSIEQARKGAEKVVGGLIRSLLASRRRHYFEGMKVEKTYYAPNLYEETRRTYTRYLDAEQKERILKIEPVDPLVVHVYTSGEGMGKNRYTCAFDRKDWKISAIDVMCGDCAGSGACRWCEGKGCIDCQQTNRCVPCSGTGWMKWAK